MWVCQNASKHAIDLWPTFPETLGVYRSDKGVKVNGGGSTDQLVDQRINAWGGTIRVCESARAGAVQEGPGCRVS